MIKGDNVADPLGIECAPDRQAAPPAEPPSPNSAAQTDVGSALRAAFRATVDEQVPDTMLDLLKRLS